MTLETEVQIKNEFEKMKNEYISDYYEYIGWNSDDKWFLDPQ